MLCTSLYIDDEWDVGTCFAPGGCVFYFCLWQTAKRREKGKSQCSIFYLKKSATQCSIRLYPLCIYSFSLQYHISKRNPPSLFLPWFFFTTTVPSKQPARPASSLLTISFVFLHAFSLRSRHNNQPPACFTNPFSEWPSDMLWTTRNFSHFFFSIPLVGWMDGLDGQHC